MYSHTRYITLNVSSLSTLKCLSEGKHLFIVMQPISWFLFTYATQLKPKTVNQVLLFQRLYNITKPTWAGPITATLNSLIEENNKNN